VEVKLSKLEADRSLSPSAEVKNEWRELYLLSQYVMA
jgi:hypothetical protein